MDRHEREGAPAAPHAAQPAAQATGEAAVWIDFTMASFPVTLKITGRGAREALEALPKALAWLEARPDVEPGRPGSAAAQASAGGGGGNGWSDDNPPVCSAHGAMVRSKSDPQGWYCPKRAGDGEFCKSKVSKGKLHDAYRS